MTDSCNPTPHCLITLLGLVAEQLGYELKKKPDPDPQPNPYVSYSDKELAAALDLTMARLYVYSQRWAQMLIEKGILHSARQHYMLDNRPVEMQRLSEVENLILDEMKRRKLDGLSRMLYTPFSEWVNSGEALELVSQHLQAQRDH